MPSGSSAFGDSTSATALGVDPLNGLGAQISAAANQYYSSIFGGIVATESATHLDVYLTEPNLAAESALTMNAPAGVVTFLGTPNSLSYLLSLQMQVLSDTAQLKSKGIEVEQVYPDIQSGLLEVGVQSLTPADSEVLGTTFENPSISLFGVSSGETNALTATRNFDTSPWHGGDNVASTTEACTGGVPIKLGSTTYMLEAGHCFAVGTSIYNLMNTGSGSGTLMGTGYSQDLSNMGTDTGVLNIRTSSSILTGPIGSPSTTSLTNYTSDIVGQTVCNDGAYSGETCSIVNEVNVCVLQGAPRNGYACDLDHAADPSESSVVNETGDSGAPMLMTVSGSVEAVGTVSSSITADTVPCQYNTSGNTCYWDVYFTEMAATLSEYHATIN
jgi:hypothetical protein